MAYSYDHNLKPVYSVDGDVTYELHKPNPDAGISMHAQGGDEMLRVTADGFYVRGVKVPVDDAEALTVYKAFKQWMTWAALNNKY